MIEVEDLTKRFGKVEALRGVSFAAADGQITGLLGPNGAGKSTTLRILCTVLNADGGSARVGGIDVREHPMAVRRGIGVLPHNSNLFANLSARENIAYYAALQGLDGRALERAVDHMVERLGIASFATRRAKGFSQGQRLRVALARALVHEPDTLILDEPTNGLDVMTIRVLRDVIRERRDSGCCVLFSSHVMQEIDVLCDRIAVVAEGRTVVDGTADEIRDATGCDDLEDAFVTAVAESSRDVPAQIVAGEVR